MLPSDASSFFTRRRSEPSGRGPCCAAAAVGGACAGSASGAGIVAGRLSQHASVPPPLICLESMNGADQGSLVATARPRMRMLMRTRGRGGAVRAANGGPRSMADMAAERRVAGGPVTEPPPPRQLPLPQQQQRRQQQHPNQQQQRAAPAAAAAEDGEASEVRCMGGSAFGHGPCAGAEPQVGPGEASSCGGGHQPHREHTHEHPRDAYKLYRAARMPAGGPIATRHPAAAVLERGASAGNGEDAGPSKRARSLAARIIDRCPMSAWELQARLVERCGVEPDEAAAACKWLQDVGLQSDAELAEVWVRSRWNQQHKAPRTIRAELLRKRVCADVVDRALSEFFGRSAGTLGSGVCAAALADAAAGGCGIDDVMCGGGAGTRSASLSSVDEEWARQQVLAADLLQTVRSKLERMPCTLSGEAKRRRLAAWLMRRGHDFGVIRQLLELLGV